MLDTPTRRPPDFPSPIRDSSRLTVLVLGAYFIGAPILSITLAVLALYDMWRSR
jgi:hypothetical protein